ncbi:MAG: hypothetical protein BMS9Abin24_064 [Thermodesulfobacteriota bacterium]|nr:MAG: hypothetical protein BMS9Abin24_064 [Thermodesulfobacteriota bacterium]
MTFMEYLKVKKKIDTEGKQPFEFMDEYYDEYLDYLRGMKDGCSKD